MNPTDLAVAELQAVLAANPNVLDSKTSGLGPTIVVDVAPEIRAAVCRIVRQNVSRGWIIVRPRDEKDQLVPVWADCLGASEKYKRVLADRIAHGEALNPWMETEPDLLVCDGIISGPPYPTPNPNPPGPTWRVTLKAGAPEPKSNRLARFFRRSLFCSRGMHRTTEQRSSVFRLLVCRDCERQVGYLNR